MDRVVLRLAARVVSTYRQPTPNTRLRPFLTCCLLIAIGCGGRILEGDKNPDPGPSLGTGATAGGTGTTGTGAGGGSAAAVSLGASGNGSSNYNGGSGGSNVSGGGGSGNGGGGNDGGGSGGWLGDAGIPSCTATPADGTGMGLKGEYFIPQDLTGLPSITRTDAKIDFDWGFGSPDPAIPIDHFSVRWTGQVQPRYAGKYTFFTTSDDGSRVFVDGKTVVDAFVDQSGGMENAGTIDLVAGQKYTIKVEYYDNTANALIHVLWSSVCHTKEIIPTSQLFPTGDTGT